jgi:Ser-tRNA(Ala) deacylase AlaX
VKKSIDPRMHSAEHVLNQAMDRMFGCGRCVTAHIERKKSKCDYRFDRPLTGEEEVRIEEEVNRVLRADLPVTERFAEREACAARFDLDRLPEDAGDRIRIVEVGDYDACPCIGPHVRSTAEIGSFRIVSTDFREGFLRIRYKLGSAEPS